MWIYSDKIYDKLSSIRKINHLSTTNMKWLQKNNYIRLINEKEITTDTEIITYIERLPYEPKEATL